MQNDIASLDYAAKQCIWSLRIIHIKIPRHDSSDALTVRTGYAKPYRHNRPTEYTESYNAKEIVRFDSVSSSTAFGKEADEHASTRRLPVPHSPLTTRFPPRRRFPKKGQKDRHRDVGRECECRNATSRRAPYTLQPMSSSGGQRAKSLCRNRIALPAMHARHGERARITTHEA